jgi:hypothetical protein
VPTCLQKNARGRRRDSDKKQAWGVDSTQGCLKGHKGHINFLNIKINIFICILNYLYLFVKSTHTFLSRPLFCTVSFTVVKVV